MRAHPPFALTLRGPRNQPFGQGIHPLLHPERGCPDLFVAPAGPFRLGRCYEGTFNRTVRGPAGAAGDGGRLHDS